MIRNANRIEPLNGGRECTYCRKSPRSTWPPVVVFKSAIYNALRQSYPAASALNGVATIRVSQMTPEGRAIWLDVAGPSGRSIRLRAEDLRLALLMSGAPQAQGLYSMNCKIGDRGDSIAFTEGRGFGHGVGLCQWGAQGMAERGYSAKSILGFYYPGAKLYRAY